MAYLRYGFMTKLEQSTFDDAMGVVTRALEKEGFGILTEIDVKQTLEKKLGAEFRRYTILGACNPVLAKQALEHEPHIGLLLPCNVVVQEAPEGGVIVSVADPREMFTLVDNPDVQPLAKEVGQRLRRVMASLHRATTSRTT